MTELIEAEGMTVKEAQDEITALYEREFGAENIVTSMVRGSLNVRSKISGDKTKVEQRSGGTYYVVTETSDAMKNKIRNMGGNSFSTRQPDTQRDTGEVSRPSTPQGDPSEMGEIPTRQPRQTRQQDEVSSPSRPSQTATDGNTLIDVNNDDSIVFMPPFTKAEAEYTPPGEGRAELDCKDCAHYIEGGGCHIVQGAIEDNAYCEEFYADAGLYFDVDNPDDVNLAVWGERFVNRVEQQGVEQTVMEMVEGMKGRLDRRFGEE